jgi:hypothetical protein
MSKVKRYNPDPYCRCNTWNEADDGCIVAASDYDALKTERDLLWSIVESDDDYFAGTPPGPLPAHDLTKKRRRAYDVWKRSQGGDDA